MKICYTIFQMKKKLFYFIFSVFLTTGLTVSPVCADMSDFSDEVQAEIKKIQKHNKEQEKNEMSLNKFYQKNPNSMTPQDDDYWDLAWHARLADQGDEESQFVIAEAYEKGKDVIKNPQKAVAFYKKSCDQKHISACMRLGAIYLENKWLKADKEKALYWYTKAAKEEYTPAQFKVASLYEEQNDYIAAVLWMEQAVKTLFPQASDLADHAPELTHWRNMAKLQEKMKARGVKNLLLHENCIQPLSPAKVR